MKQLFKTLFICSLFLMSNPATAETYDEIRSRMIEHTFQKQQHLLLQKQKIENQNEKFENNYDNDEINVLSKYFKKQAKYLKKIWNKNTLIADAKYKTSFARVLLQLNSDGSIKYYEIKSSCVPKNDKVFLKSIDKILSNLKFDKLPPEYKNDNIIFTIKFHSKFPNSINAKSIDWTNYGIADIEIGRKKEVIFIRGLHK